MNYGAIKKLDVANGEGLRTTLFVSGCRNRCKNCFQPETWDFSYGKPFTEDTWEEIFASLSPSSVRGLTLLGGEPMEPENQRALLPFLRELKRRYPDKSLWLYTGNLYEEITAGVGNHEKCIEVTEELLSYVDILVDGRFIEEEKEIGLRFRGSKNQRIIDMRLTRHDGAVVIWEGVALDRHYNPSGSK